MFERFSDEARRMVVLAQEEARLLRHNWIGTEHVLLGAIRAEGVAAEVFAAFGLTLDRVRSEVEARTEPVGGTISGHIPFTPDAKKTLEMALREALKLGDSFIGGAHIVLGLLAVPESLGAQIVASVSDDVDEIRRWLEENRGTQAATSAAGPEPSVETVSVAMHQAVRIPSMPFPTGHECTFCGRDPGEVERAVTGRAGAICTDCIAAAAAAVESADASGLPAYAPVHLPPRVFGAAPSDPGAVAAVTEALRIACGSPTSAEEKAAVIEDGETLAPLIVRASSQVPGTSLAVVAVRFLTDDHAQVRFEIVLSGGGRFPFEGELVRRDGRWLVTRETIAGMLRRAGMDPPP